jgi:glucose-1-phosphate adenylyltransferase
MPHLDPEAFLVLNGDILTDLDLSALVEFHREHDAVATITLSPVEDARPFGLVATEPGGRVLEFREKPPDPTPIPGDPDHAYGSMGIYVFTTAALVDMVTRDAEDPTSKHDVGGSLVPMFVERGDAAVYDFAANEVPGATPRDRGYWRDVGDLDSYYEASMDLIASDPIFNLYNGDWPIYGWWPTLPPAKFVHDRDGRRGQALNSMVCSGVIVSGGTVRRSILSPDVAVHTGALVEGCVLMDGVDIGRGAVVRNSIIDKNVIVPPGAEVGVDREADRRRYQVSRGGIVALGKGQAVWIGDR